MSVVLFSTIVIYVSLENKTGFHRLHYFFLSGINHIATYSNENILIMTAKYKRLFCIFKPFFSCSSVLLTNVTVSLEAILYVPLVQGKCLKN